MRKLIAALAAIIAATNGYWERNKKEDYPGLPEDDNYADSFENAQQVLLEAEQNFTAHIDKVGEIYESTKTKIMQLQANALSHRRMPEAGEDLQAIFVALQELRDLACAQYDPETYALLHTATTGTSDDKSQHTGKKLDVAADRHAQYTLGETIYTSNLLTRNATIYSFIEGAQWMEKQLNNEYPVLHKNYRGKKEVQLEDGSTMVKFSTLGELKEILNGVAAENLTAPPRLWGDGIGGALYACQVLNEDHINPSGEGAEPVSAYNREDISYEPVVLSKGTFMLWGDFNQNPL